jgi:hypothetical protein
MLRVLLDLPMPATLLPFQSVSRPLVSAFLFYTGSCYTILVMR